MGFAKLQGSENTPLPGIPGANIAAHLPQSDTGVAGRMWNPGVKQNKFSWDVGVGGGGHCPRHGRLSLSGPLLQESASFLPPDPPPTLPPPNTWREVIAQEEEGASEKRAGTQVVP